MVPTLRKPEYKQQTESDGLMMMMMRRRKMMMMDMVAVPAVALRANPRNP
jgi:hypothetical protein